MSDITSPDITFLRTVRQLIFPALYSSTSDWPLLSLDYPQQATGIPLSAQTFVRYETLPSSPDRSKDIQIQILYYVHVHVR